MNNKKILLALTVAVAVAGISTYSSSSVNASQEPSPTTEQNLAELKLDGVTLKKPEVTPAVSEDKAIELASQYVPGYAKEANNIKAEYQLMTNDQFTLFSDSAKSKNPKLSKSGYLEDTPVYIVTYKGITKIGHDAIGGKQPTILHEYNVVVDATSGEILYGFSYR